MILSRRSFATSNFLKSFYLAPIFLEALLFFSIVTVSCEFHNDNNAEDRAEAKGIIDSFYYKLSKGMYSELSNEFGGNATPSEALEKFAIRDSVAGQLIKYEIVDITTESITKAGVTKKQFLAKVLCTNSTLNTEEVLCIIVEENSKYIDRYGASTLE